MGDKQGDLGLQDNHPPVTIHVARAEGSLTPGHHQDGQYGYPNQKQGPDTAPLAYTPAGQQMPHGGVVLVHPDSVPTQKVVTNVVPNMATELPDHMVFNIIMTVLCCWPIGIFAIMKSMACHDAKYRGDVEQATRLSREARRLGYWTLGVGIVLSVVSVILLVFYIQRVYFPNIL